MSSCRSTGCSSSRRLITVRPRKGFYQHSAAVSQATRTPVILYNVPGRTAVDMLPATVQRLSQLPGIVAVKEAVPDEERVRELVARCPKDFAVLSG